MKCGTTTLYRDLADSPGIYLSHIKEPANLTKNDIYTEQGKAEYERLFRAASPSQLAGEATALYTALPDMGDVPERAYRLLGPQLKLIYLVRDPVTRISSHYQHLVSMGSPTLVSPESLVTIDRAVREVSPLLDWTRYAMQLEPWISWFGPEQLRIVRFERYVADRRSTVADICRFLNVEPPPPINENTVYNKTGDRPVTRGFWYRLRDHPIYRRHLARRLPLTVKDALRSCLLPKEQARPAKPSADTIDFIHDQLADDQRRLARLLEGNPPNRAVCAPVCIGIPRVADTTRTH